MTRPLDFARLMPPDRVAYLERGYRQSYVLTTVERITGTQLILANGVRARRQDGRLIGTKHVVYLRHPADREVTATRIAIEHARLRSELDSLLLRSRDDQIASAGGLLSWISVVNKMLYASRENLDAIEREVRKDQAGEPFLSDGIARPGFVAGECGHAVAKSEFYAGLRNCERCPTGHQDDGNEES